MAIGAGGHTLRERPVMGAYDNMVICSRRPFFFAAAEAKIRRADRQRQNGFSKCCWNHLLNESLRFVSVSDAPSGLSDRHFAALGTNAPRPVSGTVRAKAALPDSPTGRCAIPLRRGFPPASRETLTRLPGDLLRGAPGPCGHFRPPPEIDGRRETALLRICLRRPFGPLRQTLRCAGNERSASCLRDRPRQDGASGLSDRTLRYSAAAGFSSGLP